MTREVPVRAEPHPTRSFALLRRGFPRPRLRAEILQNQLIQAFSTLEATQLLPFWSVGHS
jgi:hypothetical protein